MADSAAPSASRSNVQAARAGYAAALSGDLAVLRELLSEEVRWHAAGDPGGGCQNREQAMVWLGDALARGARVELLDVRPLDGRRVLVLVQRTMRGEGDPAAPPPAPHGQIVTFDRGKVIEIEVYASDEEALAAAREA